MRRLAIVLSGLSLLVGGCSSSSQVGAGAVPPVPPPGRPLTYVAIGASESFGIGAVDPSRDAWPQVFYRTALPRAATLIDLGIPGATVAAALQAEAPTAERLHPDLVTVWLNVNDIIQRVPPAVFESELGALVREVRSGGAEVLVANTPPLDRTPRLRQCQPYAPAANGCDRSRRLSISSVIRVVNAYNEAIARVANETGATVVDLHAWGERVDRSGDLARFIGSDGFHPSTYGYRQIADVFAEAYRAAGH